MKRIILAFYGMAAAVVALYPMASEASIPTNHNETLVRDPQ